MREDRDAAFFMPDHPAQQPKTKVQRGHLDAEKACIFAALRARKRQGREVRGRKKAHAGGLRADTGRMAGRGNLLVGSGRDIGCFSHDLLPMVQAGRAVTQSTLSVTTRGRRRKNFEKITKNFWFSHPFWGFGWGQNRENLYNAK